MRESNSDRHAEKSCPTTESGLTPNHYVQSSGLTKDARVAASMPYLEKPSYGVALRAGRWVEPASDMGLTMSQHKTVTKHARAERSSSPLRRPRSPGECRQIRHPAAALRMAGQAPRTV